MRIIDISQPLRRGIPVWPGDQPLELVWSASIERGSTVNVGAVTMSLHTGTHADAPLHVRDGASSIDQIELDAYIGPALVVEALGTGAIGLDALSGLDLRGISRILFKTRLTALGASLLEGSRHLSLDVALAMANAGVRLVGIDTPSIDHPDSKELMCHNLVYDSNMVNLENLELTKVDPGRYTLIAFPLRIEGMDASPVRAVLIDDSV